MFGSGEVLQAVLAEVPKGNALRKPVRDEPVDAVRYDYLPAMAAGGNPRRAVHIEADVVVTDPPGFAGVQTHPHAHGFAPGPGVPGQGMLGGNHRLGSIGGTGEDHKEGVALGAQLDAVVGCNRVAHQAALVVQDASPVVPKFLEQSGGALDVREQEGDGPARAFRHGGHWLVYRPNGRPSPGVTFKTGRTGPVRESYAGRSSSSRSGQVSKAALGPDCAIVVV